MDILEGKIRHFRVEKSYHIVMNKMNSPGTLTIIFKLIGTYNMQLQNL